MLCSRFLYFQSATCQSVYDHHDPFLQPRFFMWVSPASSSSTMEVTLRIFLFSFLFLLFFFCLFRFRGFFFLSLSCFARCMILMYSQISCRSKKLRIFLDHVGVLTGKPRRPFLGAFIYFFIFIYIVCVYIFIWCSFSSLL